MKHGVLQGSILGSLLFTLYINDLPNIINNKSKSVLFTDDTSVIVTNSKVTDLKTDIFTVFEQVSEWFNVSLLLLNFDKTCFIQIITKSSTTIDMNIDYDNKSFTNITNTEFLLIVIGNTFPWKSHIDQIIPKLNASCYEIRLVKLFMSQDSLEMVYYSYFLSIMTYEIIFWGNSSYSFNIFRLQKRIIRSIMDVRI